MEVKQVNKEYEISSINTLVDLNEQLVNFKTEFKIFGKTDESEFQVAVVDQTQIDNGEFDYKTVKGKIGGSVSWDKNFYKNHFLAIKSTEPQTVNIELDITPLPKTPDNKILEDQVPIDVKNEVIKSHQVDKKQYNENNLYQSTDLNKPSMFSKLWFKIFIICSLLFIGVLVYQLFFNKKNDQLSNKIGILELNHVSNPIPLSLPTPQVTNPEPSPSPPLIVVPNLSSSSQTSTTDQLSFLEKARQVLSKDNNGVTTKPRIPIPSSELSGRIFRKFKHSSSSNDEY